MPCENIRDRDVQPTTRRTDRFGARDETRVITWSIWRVAVAFYKCWKPLRIKLPCLHGHDSRVRAPRREPIAVRFVTSLAVSTNKRGPCDAQSRWAWVKYRSCCCCCYHYRRRRRRRCVGSSTDNLVVWLVDRSVAPCFLITRSILQSADQSVNVVAAAVFFFVLVVVACVSQQSPVGPTHFASALPFSPSRKQHVARETIWRASLCSLHIARYKGHGGTRHVRGERGRRVEHTRHPARPGKHSRSDRGGGAVTLHQLLSRSFSVTWIAARTERARTLLPLLLAPSCLLDGQSYAPLFTFANAHARATAWGHRGRQKYVHAKRFIFNFSFAKISRLSIDRDSCTHLTISLSPFEEARFAIHITSRINSCKTIVRNNS